MAGTGQPKITIGILKPDNIGDAVIASPFFFNLRKHYRNAEITAFLSRAGEATLGDMCFFDTVYTVNAHWLSYEKTTFFSRIFSAFQTIMTVRKHKFDIFIGMRHQDRLTSLITSLSGAKERIGYDVAGMGFGLTKKAPMPNPGVHQLQKNMQLLKFITGKTGPEKMFFSTDVESEASITDLLKKGRIKKFMVVHPVSGHVSKDWEIEKYAKLAGKLASNSMRVVIVGSKKDTAALTIKGKNIVNLTGIISIREMGSLIKRSSFVLGNDSAAVHIASAFGKKSLTIFSGAADHNEWAAAGKDSHIIIRDVPCRKCELPVCDKPVHECVNISVEQVYKTIKNILSGKENKKIIKVC